MVGACRRHRQRLFTHDEGLVRRCSRLIQVVPGIAGPQNDAARPPQGQCGARQGARTADHVQGWRKRTGHVGGKIESDVPIVLRRQGTQIKTEGLAGLANLKLPVHIRRGIPGRIPGLAGTDHHTADVGQGHKVAAHRGRPAHYGETYRQGRVGIGRDRERRTGPRQVR